MNIEQNAETLYQNVINSAFKMSTQQSISTRNLDAVLRNLEDERVTTRKAAVEDFGSLLVDSAVVAALNLAPGAAASAASGVLS